MQNSQDLSGRRAVITGGAAGLGYAIAQKLAQAGADITVIDVAPSLDSVTLPGDWNAADIDLGASDSLDKLRELAGHLGSVDVVVANAGIVPPWRSVADLDPQEWQRVMAVNTWGVAATLAGFSSALTTAGHGSVVVMASINGYKAHPSQTLYTASKHAAIGIMRCAALDLGTKRIRVNALAPGPVATPALVQRIDDRHASGGPDPQSAFSALDAQTALGEIVSPDQVASAALWLASDASAGVTGIVLPVEAGLG
ncbi:SDR family oxidoreductase [Congregibacter sp.]|nr:SDR family oxidoreductase [Congregibacter sp.]MDA8962078.1 SDR family oxidoreductase [Congregibacter sp.]